MSGPLARPLAAAALAAALLLAARAAQAAEGSFFAGSAKPAVASAADLDAADAAAVEVWKRLPFSIRRAMFVSRKAQVFGDYEPRPSNVFSADEKLVTYLEPVGYGWKTVPGDRVQFGITTDLELATRSGKVLADQKGFQTVTLESRYRTREFFATLTLSLDGIEPGDYVLSYTVHDAVGGRAARVDQPFTIKAGG